MRSLQKYPAKSRLAIVEWDGKCYTASCLQWRGDEDVMVAPLTDDGGIAIYTANGKKRICTTNCVCYPADR